MSNKRKDIEKSWLRYAERLLVGKRIKNVRYLDEEEQEQLGWYSSTIVMVLEDGTLIFPSKDDEGNDAGALFGQSPKGEEIVIPVVR